MSDNQAMNDFIRRGRHPVQGMGQGTAEPPKPQGSAGNGTQNIPKGKMTMDRFIRMLAGVIKNV